MTTRRLFFALWLDESAARAAHQAATEIAGRIGGRVMRQDSLHLTLAFLGGTAAEKTSALLPIAETLASEIPPFSLTLDQFGYWPGNRIVWASCRAACAPLNKLAGRLNDELCLHGFPIDRRPFHPHVTLLRNVHSTEPPGVDACAIQTRVDEFRLVESIPLAAGGFRHEAIAHWRLTGIKADD